MDNTDQELDHLIEAALTAYSSAEPRFGLEQRILNRVRTEGHKRRSFLWMPIAAIVAACTLVLATILWVPRTAEPVRLNTPAIDLRATGTISRADSRSAAGRLRPAQARSEKSPKRQRRRDPALPTDQERALLILAQYSPEMLKALRSEDQPVTIEPITIAAIEIKPLQSGEGE